MPNKQNVTVIKKDKKNPDLDHKQDEQNWEFVSDSIHFWSFKDYPVFIGRYSCEYESTEFYAFVFIEEDTKSPWLIAQNKAVVSAINKEREITDKKGKVKKVLLKEMKNAIFKIQFIGNIPLKSGKSFNRYNIHVSFDK